MAWSRTPAMLTSLGATFSALLVVTTGNADGAWRAGAESARALLIEARASIEAGKLEAARRGFREAAAVAEASGAAGLAASIWNDLGALEASEGLLREAAESLDKAVALAGRARRPELEGRARANRARVTLDAGRSEGVLTDLDAALAAIVPRPDASEKAFALVGIARGYERLRTEHSQEDSALMLRAHDALNEALRIADRVGDPRTASFALGYLGALYAADRRPEEALELTRRAVARADVPEAIDTQYLWRAQAGRIHRDAGEIEAASAAFREALTDLEVLRPAAADLYGPVGAAFREERGRIHRDLVAVLLELRAGETSVPAGRLQETQRTLERMRADELRNYFQDDCVDAYRARLTDPAGLSASARVVQPILLPGRTRILVSGPEETHEFTSPIGTTEIAAAARRLRRAVVNRTSFGFRSSARELYDGLIAPIREAIGSSSIDTLVFVPDGPLRGVPLAALHDGERYLIERYALAVTPSLELADPRPFDRSDPRVFLGGVSEPVQGFAPLPHVRSELAEIQELYGGSLRLDAEFTEARVTEDLGEPFNVVHVATHAEFNGRNADTFVLTYDDRLSLDEFTDRVGRFRFRETPLELLTLSACETASGDERAALGLAGLAVKAGARSVVATLWEVNDRAASQLMVDFYRKLHEPGTSRASALRSAQLALLRERPYRHPAYWSAFVLVGNWL